MTGLGRLYTPDERDHKHLARKLLPTSVTVDTRTRWRFRKPVLDQMATSCCVGFAWRHFLRCAPMQTNSKKTPDAFTIYDEATRLDEWIGNEGDRTFGTSVRAGAQALQARGHIKSYVWAFTLTDAVSWLLTSGPLVFGTDWSHSMFRPDAEGIVRFKPESGIAGGHAWLCRGVDLKRGMAGPCPNSWGEWGKGGEFYIPLEDLEHLMIRDAEACAAVEAKV